MKKMNLTKLMAVLVVLCLITSTFVGSTLAKYITADDAADAARVAKFGVEVVADGSLFEAIYKDAPLDTDDGTATVVAYDSADVVAPGTNNEADAFTFSIKGKPEVDVKIDVVVEDADEDVFLKAGTYEDLTTGDPADEYQLGADYYPIKYKLTNEHDGVIIEDATLAELKAKLVAISTAKVEANTDLGAEFGKYEISWKWAYEGVDDKADTILGDLAAGTPVAGLNGAALEAGMDKDYNLGTGLKVTVTVTQID